MEKNRVRLNICGADYTITTEDDPKYVMALGDELDAALTKTLVEKLWRLLEGKTTTGIYDYYNVELYAPGEKFTEKMLENKR